MGFSCLFKVQDFHVMLSSKANNCVLSKYQLTKYIHIWIYQQNLDICGILNEASVSNILSFCIILSIHGGES